MHHLYGGVQDRKCCDIMKKKTLRREAEALEGNDGLTLWTAYMYFKPVFRNLSLNVIELWRLKLRRCRG